MDAAGDPLLHVAVEFRALRVGSIAGVDQAGVGDQAAEQIVDRLVAPHRLEQTARPAASRPSLPLIGFLERDAFGVGAVEIALDLDGIDTRVEIGEIPFGQRDPAGLHRSGGCNGGPAAAVFRGMCGRRFR